MAVLFVCALVNTYTLWLGYEIPKLTNATLLRNPNAWYYVKIMWAVILISLLIMRIMLYLFEDIIDYELKKRIR